MYDEDELVFLRAILVNPADAALKLVYADWLQERDDPRAEYARHRARMQAEPGIASAVESGMWLATVGVPLDAGWLTFMRTLAEPFVPGVCAAGDPFADAIGTHGGVAVFESPFNTAEPDAGLLADLAFVSGVDWGVCAYGYNAAPISGFVCELPPECDPDTEGGLRAAFRVAEYRSMSVSTAREDQFMFDHDFHWSDGTDAHDDLSNYVSGGMLWYLSLPLDHRPPNWREGFTFEAVATVGRSPHGARLVGAIAVRMDRR